MNLTQRQLDIQLARVHAKGWWEHIEDAAAAVFPAGEFDAFDLFAIGSRETNWDPRYLHEPGDGGNGYGPMQIDKGSYPKWVASGAWRNPRAAILKGAQVLREKLDAAVERQGKTITVRAAGETYSMAGAVLSPENQKRVAIAAYNSGAWAYWHFSKGRDPDRGTTGADYSRDVLERAAAARKCCVIPQKKGGADAVPD